MLPKLIITDIDGVWTDGGMYYDTDNIELKKFNTSDSVGVLWCKLNEIPVVIITGENSAIVTRRAKKLNIDTVFLGAKNKVEILDQFLNDQQLNWSDVAFIGDDINDIAALKKVGFSGCPMNAPNYVKSIVDVVVPINGGSGAFRGFIEHILDANGILQSTLEKYLSEFDTSLEQ